MGISHTAPSREIHSEMCAYCLFCLKAPPASSLPCESHHSVTASWLCDVFCATSWNQALQTLPLLGSCLMAKPPVTLLSVMCPEERTLPLASTDWILFYGRPGAIFITKVSPQYHQGTESFQWLKMDVPWVAGKMFTCCWPSIGSWGVTFPVWPLPPHPS